MKYNRAEIYLINKYFYPSFYFKKLSKMEAQYSIDEREKFLSKSKELKEEALKKCTALFGWSWEKIEKCMRAVEELVHVFQRSTSSIEGRNSHLSLHIHKRKKQCERSRETQRVLKNFFVLQETERLRQKDFSRKKPGICLLPC